MNPKKLIAAEQHCELSRASNRNGIDDATPSNASFIHCPSATACGRRGALRPARKGYRWRLQTPHRKSLLAH